MKMSIARALKEKNRLIGKINQIRTLISSENVKSFNYQIKDGETYDAETLLASASVKRKVDVKKLEIEWKELEEKLINLKIAIQKANSGALDILIRLQEAKSHLTQIDQIQFNENDVVKTYSGYVSVVSACFGQEYQLAEKEKYTNLVNELQDKIDEYNATVQVELAD